MKKILLTSFIVLLAAGVYSQLNNSWIDYSKTYYKFKLAKDTLTRINQPVLAAAGLGNVPAEQFQLWRNGQQVRLFTSVPTGIMGSGDYIEFWGEMNDGKPDKALYQNPSNQLGDKYSLETDTATYFLTVNPAGANLRYVSAANNTAGNLLPADLFCMKRIEMNFRQQINKGYADVSYTEYLFSSSYDAGEGWTSNDVFPGYPLALGLQNMNSYLAVPANTLTFAYSVSGNAPNTRELFVRFNGNTISQKPMPYFGYLKDTLRNLPLSLLTNPTNLQVVINGNSTNTNDRVVVSSFALTYPGTFNFNNQKNFYFELKNSTVGNYLVITNFNNNGVAPVLYDHNTNSRYVGDISTAGQVKFALPASSDTVRRFNLVSQDASNINLVTLLTSKFFVNYANTSLQGDYIIISNPVLYNNGNGVNNVELYRQYRSSSTGGGFNAKIYNIDELNDQFAFGIKKHPSAIRDFIRYASQNFATAPKYVFIIGRGLSYFDYTANQANPLSDQLDLVQTFGWPASDILLSAAPGTLFPLVPIGRVGAISGNEVGVYLDKMKQYEQAQQSTSQAIADKGWMKNVLHTIGASNSFEEAEFTSYMNGYKSTVEDTLFGGHVETFSKTSVATIEQQQSLRITGLFQEGLSYIKYFGHSSANELAINLNYPENYQNNGKYPFMHVSGCTVGNFFTFSPTRVNGYAGMSLSEKYIFLDHKGSIGFLGSTHFGVGYHLNKYNVVMHDALFKNMYGNTIGNQLKSTLQTLSTNPGLDFVTKIHLEEINLHGDPALKINAHAKPDYVIEDQLVKFTPGIITVGDQTFKLDVKHMNIGRAIKDSIRVTVKQKLPNDTIRVLYDQKISAALYMDSINLLVNINPITDKGLNRLIVTLDVDGRVDELSEMNNPLTKDFYIFEDELRPIYPYNYSIVNQQNITFYGSTANPLSGQRQYVMEVDTTELFNSAFKRTYNISGTGGLVQFNASNITFTDSTVYYWRTSTVPAPGNNYIWNVSSFVYLANSTAGYNQSHYFQHLRSSVTDLKLQSNRKWEFDKYTVGFKIKNGVFPTAARNAPDFAVELDGNNDIQSVCGVSAIIINVFSPFGMMAWRNVFPGTGLYGSDDVCGPERKWNFQYNLLSQSKRIAAVNFLDMVPNGYYVTVRNTSGIDPLSNTYPNTWQDDTLAMGSGNSLYHRLKNAGFTDVDSFNRPRAFNFIYKKADNSFIPLYKLSDGIYDKIVLDAACPGSKASGTITSPLYGPARSWSQFHWRGSREETGPGDSLSFKVIGVTNAGVETELYTVDSTQKDFNISAINASQYPYLKLKMYNQDTVQGTPYQLRYWRVNGEYVPEGAVAPNILFSMKDTCEQGELVDFKLAFKNISPTAFSDSMRFNFVITDRLNNPNPVSLSKGKVLVSNDTLVVNYRINTKDYPGSNTIFVEVNPNNAQPEQYHFNNILFKELYVKADNYNPLLDVTFDGVHILNEDIVSAKPHILINLKDESRFMALSDTALLKVQVRFPDGSLHNYNFGGDTMRFTPANLSTGNNTAVIDFLPYFPDEGFYELIVSGKDMVGNTAGAIEYHIKFHVITKAMISNLLNYPNPFTTSTAFVFYITGTEVPQNIRIQVLTITGKVVREITKDELGPLHIGRNITEFKWDGTDMYGAKLANGVYLYWVLTNLNGKSLDKFKDKDAETDKYFNKGYGKMVLIR